ncbi:hypothetical protein AWC38_SpisGene21058 [Stylophora pistillata]|uniref:Uncharacterized protein n=1 Tax=Stylophora pistillata TaxID=50429 RepID=A0A2B4RES8_STYPI|nr:hypothetical protein AWC38_SpisGene21058 [Stylophora pistillata]
MPSNEKAAKAKIQEEELDDGEEKFQGTPDTSILSKRRKRRHAIAVNPVNGNSICNLGFEDDRRDDTEKGKFSSTTVRNQKTSVTFGDSPGLSNISSMDEGPLKILSLADLTKDGKVLNESVKR